MSRRRVAGRARAPTSPAAPSSPGAAAAAARRRPRRAASPCSSRRTPARCHSAPAPRRGSSTPGAVTSGFSCSETGVGPAEEKHAITRRTFVGGGDGDRVGARAGGADRAVAERRRSRCRRRRPGRRRPRPRRRSPARRGRACGSISGSPSERLMTFMPSRDGRLDPCGDLGRVPVEAELAGRDRQHLVVAEVRPRRDPRRRCTRPPARACRGRRRRCRRRASRARSSPGRTAGSRSGVLSPGGGKARATITFAVV